MALPSCNAISEVIGSILATPLTPSVPNSLFLTCMGLSLLPYQDFNFHLLGAETPELKPGGVYLGREARGRIETRDIYRPGLHFLQFPYLFSGACCEYRLRIDQHVRDPVPRSRPASETRPHRQLDPDYLFEPEVYGAGGEPLHIHSHGSYYIRGLEAQCIDAFLRGAEVELGAYLRWRKVVDKEPGPRDPYLYLVRRHAGHYEVLRDALIAYRHDEADLGPRLPCHKEPQGHGKDNGQELEFQIGREELLHFEGALHGNIAFLGYPLKAKSCFRSERSLSAARSGEMQSSTTSVLPPVSSGTT